MTNRPLDASESELSRVGRWGRGVLIYSTYLVFFEHPPSPEPNLSACLSNDRSVSRQFLRTGQKLDRELRRCTHARTFAIPDIPKSSANLVGHEACRIFTTRKMGPTLSRQDCEDYVWRLRPIIYIDTEHRQACQCLLTRLWSCRPNYSWTLSRLWTPENFLASDKVIKA